MIYSDIDIIPMPKKVLPEEGEFTRVKIPFSLFLPEKWKEYAEVFFNYSVRLHGVKITFGKDGICVLEDGELKEGSYILDTRNKPVIRTGSETGLAYAFATLLQMMDEKGTVPAVYIEDYPECPYRGVMVDLARKVHTIDQVICYIDYCYLLKIDHIQLHFSDNEGYVLPSKKFPKLPTEGHFDEKEINTIREYALKRKIKIIPELDLPGHSASILKAYPEYFGNKDYSGETPDNAICVGKSGVFEKLGELIDEVISFFPESEWFHIGGDEVNFESWKRSLECNSYMHKNGIESVEKLYIHVVKRLTDIILSKGKTPVVWEGFPEDGCEELSDKVIVIAWESYYQTADKLLQHGFKVINCSWQPLYVVKDKGWVAKDILSWNIYNWQHWWPKSSAHLNPIHVCPTDRVLGGQLCAWEGNFEEEMIRVKQNLSALSERTWTVRRYCEDEQFEKKLKTVLPLLDKIQQTRKV